MGETLDVCKGRLYLRGQCGRAVACTGLKRLLASKQLRIPELPPHHFNLNVSDEIHWVNTPTMAAALGVSSRTLHSYLHKATSPFIEGRHYRRQSPAPKSPWIWDKTLTVKAWSAEVAA
jgi:hypothetical protein